MKFKIVKCSVCINIMSKVSYNRNIKIKSLIIIINRYNSKPNQSNCNFFRPIYTKKC